MRRHERGDPHGAGCAGHEPCTPAACAADRRACASSARQLALLRVEAELDVEHVELVVMIQHPGRRQHHRRPPLAGPARSSPGGTGIIQPHHGVTAGRIAQVAYIHMTCRHRRNPDRAGARVPGGRGDSRFRRQNLPLHARRAVVDRCLGDASCDPGPEIGSRPRTRSARHGPAGESGGAATRHDPLHSSTQ